MQLLYVGNRHIVWRGFVLLNFIVTKFKENKINRVLRILTIKHDPSRSTKETRDDPNNYSDTSRQTDFSDKDP